MKREHTLRRKLESLKMLGEAITAMKSLSAHHLRAARAELADARDYRDGVDRVIAEAGIAQVSPKGGAAAVLLLAFTYDRKKIGRFAIINAAIILSLLLVLPFFTTFWRDVFHPLLFKNNLWINNRYDLSFYIMPRQFFKYTVALLVALSVSLNVIIWLLFRKSAKKA